MVVGMIIIDCRSTIEIWMGGVLSRRLIFRFPKSNEYRGRPNMASCPIFVVHQYTSIARCGLCTGWNYTSHCSSHAGPTLVGSYNNDGSTLVYVGSLSP